ncbi:MAG: nucleotide exchange factor GrpE [Candidatus Diapherotrites archaeon]|jgi:molecular chaperone GrpE|uniref:Nucleotide exchange factor GrpE n=1 Tax=Candidatus Iainarchaeum sp. TaxID=3101447 RepID=A0A7K4BZR2_9ARCH|nr:nucleotide exchange factor GrpE [Candidatus Diapherotrites archaeon]
MNQKDNKINSVNSQKNEQKIENKNELNKDQEKIKELTETLQRLQAEFENYQKRTIKSNQEYKEFANASIIEQLLSVLDTLEQGVKHNKEFVLVYEQLYSILKKNGLEKINICEGDDFDHETMDCLVKENSLLNEDKITKVLLNGYLLNKKILRPAKVSISNGKKENLVENKISENKIEENKIEEKEIENGKEIGKNINVGDKKIEEKEIENEKELEGKEIKKEDKVEMNGGVNGDIKK